jgi:GNAT superfamily N-acetyltransferase
MRFPHAYGPVPLAAVTSVLPYRPVPDGGGFAPPLVPEQDPANRLLTLQPSVLRRAATAERPVTGGVAVLTEPYPASYQHNQLLIDGPTDAATVAAEADRVLGEAGLPHRKVRLSGDGPAAALGADLAALGWTVEPLVGMAAPVGEPGEPAAGEPWAEEVERLRLTVLWRADWHRDQPGISDDEVAQLIGRYEREEPVCDLRYLAVFADHRPVAACIVKIDGATALIDAVATDPDHRGRGHGDALLRTARSIAAAAGCDLLVLDALEADWPREWYARRGFTEVTRMADATLAPKRP